MQIFCTTDKLEEDENCGLCKAIIDDCKKILLVNYILTPSSIVLNCKQLVMAQNLGELGETQVDHLLFQKLDLTSFQTGRL